MDTRTLLGGTIGGATAGVIGALVWAGIAYSLNVEIGWIAILVGAGVGFGVVIGAKDVCDSRTGVLAAAIAILSVCGGKYLVVDWHIDDFSRTINEGFAEIQWDKNDVLSVIADQIAFDRIVSGKNVRWPNGGSWEDAYERNDYPKDIWKASQDQYRQFTDEEVELFRSFPAFANSDYCVAQIADDIAIEWEESGMEVDWPDLNLDIDEEDLSMPYEKAFPRDVWSQANVQWKDMSSGEQDDFRQNEIEEYRKMISEIGAQFAGSAQSSAFWASWGVFDILFLVFACGAAFKVGSGLETA